MIPLFTHTWASSPHTSLPWFLQTDMDTTWRWLLTGIVRCAVAKMLSPPGVMHSVSHGGGWLVAVPTASAAQPLARCWGSLLLPGPAEGCAALR